MASHSPVGTLDSEAARVARRHQPTDVAPPQVDVIEYGWRRVAVTVRGDLGCDTRDRRHDDRQRRAAEHPRECRRVARRGAFIVTGYIVANVVVIPLSPWLQRRFGRRQYFFASIALFTAASVMCGLSHDLWSLVFWRVVQGTGGGGLLSQAQAILRETYPKKQQGMAQAIFAVGAIVGPTLGPLMGGLITDNASWEWCFFVNLPNRGGVGDADRRSFCAIPLRPEASESTAWDWRFSQWGSGRCNSCSTRVRKKTGSATSSSLGFSTVAVIGSARS